MSSVEETVKSPRQERSAHGAVWDIFTAFVEFLSSVKLGVVLLVILVILSILGMVIIQQNVQGFDAHYASYTPAERTVFGALGFFDIYHSWYYNFLLLILSLNIILASIDRIGTAWSYISSPKLFGTAGFLKRQIKSEEAGLDGDSPQDVAERVSRAFRDQGFKPVVTLSEDLDARSRMQLGIKDEGSEGPAYVFGQKGKWNRMGAYIVHVSLLTLFLGHFVALQTGFDADVNMIPGEVTNEIQLIEINLDQRERYAVGLPFTITCLEIQQKLIDPNGPIETFNTLDWRTRIQIDDPDYGRTVADVSMNNPFSYRGYRFFQAQTIPVGNARTMEIQMTPQDGGSPFTIDLERTKSVKLDDGTVVAHEAFMPDFTFNAQGQPDTRSADYNNPVAILQVTPPGGETERVFAFAANVSDDIPVGAPKLGYKWRMTDFEKSPLAHVLSIKYDPYNGAFIAWYWGGFGLMGALVFVFFFSHRRVWAMIGDRKPDGTYRVIVAGDTNRNHFAFEKKFNGIVTRLTGRPPVDVDNDRESD
ncbi:MAG: hypothetical protein DWQ43_12135 [Acidobacteria bacterium]|nr:MAG: hypothetical protein DWQ32_06445 [Acidobacteriota bacterium]REK01353.1 MAG: hypothetical protein DWQ38_02880 [Acidobacteriota bacterium]REK14309.1 MAG: hypothetical protein DWQ43_12135 [Acidobacteriota bacterium]